MFERSRSIRVSSAPVIGWFIIAMCWACPAAVIAGILAVVLYGGQPSGVGKTKPGMTADQVRGLLGSPNHEAFDARELATFAKPEDRCPVEEVQRAWVYKHWFANDGVVFFDRSESVVCSFDASMLIDRQF